jgi:putative FmdB family regulatory protein
MPIYEYACSACGCRFEKLVRRFAEEVSCSACASSAVEKQLSVFAVGGASAASSSADASCAAPGCGAGACGSGACALPN